MSLYTEYDINNTKKCRKIFSPTKSVFYIVLSLENDMLILWIPELFWGINYYLKGVLGLLLYENIKIFTPDRQCISNS